MLEEGDTKTTFIHNETQYGGPLNSGGWWDHMIFDFIRKHSLKIEHIEKHRAKYFFDILDQQDSLKSLIISDNHKESINPKILSDKVDEIRSGYVKKNNKELFNKIFLLENEGLKKIENAIIYINKNMNINSKIDNWVIKNLEGIVKNLAERGQNFPFEIKFSDHDELKKINNIIEELKRHFIGLSLIDEFDAYKFFEKYTPIYSSKLYKFAEKNKITIQYEDSRYRETDLVIIVSKI